MDEQIIGKSIYHKDGDPLDFNQMLGRTALYDEDGNPLNLLTEEEIEHDYVKLPLEDRSDGDGKLVISNWDGTNSRVVGTET